MNGFQSSISLFAATLMAAFFAHADGPRFTKRAPGAPPPPVDVAVLTGLDALHQAIDGLGKAGLPAIQVEDLARNIRLRPFASGWMKKRKDARGVPTAATINLNAAEMLDMARLALEVFRINLDAQRAAERRRRDLAARGIEEVPASTGACRFTLDLGGGGTLQFDCWGECHVDRRFISERDMAVVRRLEACYRRAFASSAYSPGTKGAGKAPVAPVTADGMEDVRAEDEIMEAAALLPQTRQEDARRRKVPIFRGFEDARYQRHDALILKLTREFNAHKADWIGGSTNQAAKVADLTPALVKSHMIEETGGNGPMSLAAWPIDPQQVNVPGDWSDAKVAIGLKKPVRRNEGTAEANVRAAIKFLARKGFGSSGQPAGRRPTGFFDGWPTALKRYNARRDRTFDNRVYSDAYSEKIRTRAANPNMFVPIEIRLQPKVAAQPPAPGL